MNELILDGDFDLEQFFELSADLICIAGYDGYFKKINSAVPKTLGYTLEELFASPIDTFVHPDDRDITKRKRENIKKDNPLLNFENRYLTKDGNVVWLTWTSMPVKSKQVVFAIAKDITYKKNIEEYRRISMVLNNITGKKKTSKQSAETDTEQGKDTENNNYANEVSVADQAWLNEIAALVRKYTGKIDVSIGMLSNELAISERQLYRRIKSIIGITPNNYIRIIRLQLAKEAIETGKYRTIAEISYIAGFDTPSYFSKLFYEIYGIKVSALI